MARTSTAGDVADALHVRPATVRKYAREDRLPYDTTPGGHRRFDVEEAVAAILGRPVGEGPEPAGHEGFYVTPDGRKPAEDWLQQLPTKPASEVIAVVIAVRDAPPPAFAGGGKWEAMHGEMAGVYEVRARYGDQLHRMFCLLDRNHPDGPALVMLDGDSKPNRTAMPEAVYRRVRRQRDDYLDERRVDFS